MSRGARIWTQAVWVQRLSLDHCTTQVRMWVEKAIRTFRNTHGQSSANGDWLQPSYKPFSWGSLCHFFSFVSFNKSFRSWISTVRETSLLFELSALGSYKSYDSVLKLSLALSIPPPFQVIKNKRSVNRLNTSCFCSASTSTYACWTQTASCWLQSAHRFFKKTTLAGIPHFLTIA